MNSSWIRGVLCITTNQFTSVALHFSTTVTFQPAQPLINPIYKQRQHGRFSVVMDETSEYSPHNSLSFSPLIAAINADPYPLPEIQSIDDSFAPQTPSASHLPEAWLSDHRSQSPLSGSHSAIIGTPTSSDLAAEEQLTTHSLNPHPPARLLLSLNHLLLPLRSWQACLLQVQLRNDSRDIHQLLWIALL